MIIGLCGFKSSGKNTAANFLKGYYSDSFAAPVKDVASIVFNWSRDMLEGDIEQSRIWREQPDEFWSDFLKKPFTPRDGLTLIGTDAFRKVVHDNIWIRSLESRIKDKENVVVTDVRFINEGKFIKDIGGKLVWIKKHIPTWFNDALDYHQTGKISEELSKIHPSEYEWLYFYNNFDYVIDNTGDLKNLERQMGDIV